MYSEDEEREWFPLFGGLNLKYKHRYLQYETVWNKEDGFTEAS